MKTLCDYMIIQRRADGTGRVVFEGGLPENFSGIVIARVMSEEDNSTVVNWQECEISGGKWSTELTVPAGGLYRAEARSRDCAASFNNNSYDWGDLLKCVYHFGVGDIFVMAGQSNMSGYGKDPAYDPPQLGVHLFDNSGRWMLAAHPLSSVADPVFCNNDGGAGTSPGLSFGKMMQRKLGVPVGLVSAARGGSALESWNPAEEDPDLFRSLTEKLECVGGFAGMIWYQGCNETTEQETAETYLEKFTQTVALWREAFGYFPIVTCQLNRHAWAEENRDTRWGMVREAQRLAAKTIKGVFIVPTLDMYTSDGIHNSSGANVIIGERLALAMLRGVYGFPGQQAPSVKAAKRLTARTVQLTFEEPHSLRTMDDSAGGIDIEDENGLTPCVKIQVNDEGAVVTAGRDIGEKAVLHAYWRREMPAFFIRDIYGLPMLSCYNVTIG